MPNIDANILKQFRDALANCTGFDGGLQAMNEYELIMLATNFYNQWVHAAYDHLFGPRGDDTNKNAVLLRNTGLEVLIAISPTSKEV